MSGPTKRQRVSFAVYDWLTTAMGWLVVVWLCFIAFGLFATFVEAAFGTGPLSFVLIVGALGVIVFRKRIGGLIRRLPEKQQSVVWGVIAIAALMAFLAGVFFAYLALGFGFILSGSQS